MKFLRSTGVFVLAALFVAMPLRANPPAGLDFPPLKYSPPKVEVQTLTNGMTVFFLIDHDLPLIDMTATIKTGSMFDPENQVGLANLCGTMIRAGGTTHRSVDDINEQLEFLGASVETGMDTEAGSASFSILKKDLDVGLDIFADVLMNPKFDEKKLEVEKAKMIESIRRRNDEPFQIARREFRKLVYGKNHPLSRTWEIPVLKKLARKDLQEFYNRYYHPNNMMLAISGDFDKTELIQKLEKVFRKWKKKPVVYPEIPSVTPEQLASKKMVGYAEKSLSQATVLMGHLGVKRQNPDRFALEVMNEILGGGSFSSRLYKEVRSRLGLAYWVGSSFSEPWDYGTIVAGLQTKSETVGQSIDSILVEINRLKETAVTAEELQGAKDSIINSFVFRYASAHAIVTQTMSLKYYGYPDDYLETYPQKISAVTIQDVQNAAQKYLHPDQFKFLILGDEKNFDKKPPEFGWVKDIDLTIQE